MEEVWKDIIGYEGLYQVSNLGRVKSLNYNHTGREQVLTPSMDGWGYLFVCLYKDGKRKICLVHRLVAMAFIPNPNNLPEVNHKDENKQSNIVENLEWCDSKYNTNYGTRNKRMSEANTNGKTSKSVLQLDKTTGEVIREYPSTKEVQRQFGYSHGNISECCNGKRKTTYGYIWQYAV